MVFRPRLTGILHLRFTSIPVLAVPVDVFPTEDSEDLWEVQQDTISTIFQNPVTLTVPATQTFAQFVERLPSWEVELLRHVRLLVSPEALVTALNEGFRVVSDGSVKDIHGNGSCGWVLSSPRGDRLVYGSAPARGRSLHSYRAEAYGLLAVMRFLIQYRLYADALQDWPGILATDAQSVLDTLQCGTRDIQEAETPVDLDLGKVVLDVLCPEWDILIEIQAASKLLPHLRLQYVRGHQDDEKDYSQLDLMGQLNVNADAEAKQFVRDHGASRPQALMTPLTRCHLQFEDGTVTGHYARALQEAATTKPLKDYLQEKHGWSTVTTHVINWKGHGDALTRVPNKRTHLIKLVNDILPTHGMANKFDKGTRQCPTCPSTQEDKDHVIKCAHRTRHLWRDTFRMQLDQFLEEKGTSPAIIHLLLSAMSRWWSADDSVVTLDPDDYAPSVRTIILHHRMEATL